MMKNRNKFKCDVDWEKDLPEQILTYIYRCVNRRILTDFQEGMVRKIIINGLRQDKKNLSESKG